MSAEVALSPRALAAAPFTTEQRELLKRTVCKGSTDDEFALFLGVCERTGLDPFTKQIHAVRRKSKDPATGRWGEAMTFVVGIDGLRLVAQRTGEYEGQSAAEWCAADGAWRDSWLAAAPPAAARVGVYRRGFRQASVGFARWDSFAQMFKPDNGQPPSPMGKWRDMPEHMLAKCAEALALRKAFPQELSGLYAEEETAAMGAEPEREQTVGERCAAAAREALGRGTAAHAALPAPSGEPNELAEVAAKQAEDAARAAVAKVAAEVAAKPKWMIEAEAIAPKANQATLAAFDRGTLNEENSTRVMQGDPMLPVGAAERAAIRLRMAPRTERLKELAPEVLKSLKANHGTDFLALDVAVRGAIAYEERKLVGSKSLGATPAGAALAGSELSEGIVIVGAEADAGSLG